MSTRAGRARRLWRAVTRGLSLSLQLVLIAGLTATAVMWLASDRGVLDAMKAEHQVAATGLVVSLVVTGLVASQRRLGRSTSAHLRRMEHRASHDELTGLLNRDELFDRLDASLEVAYRHDRTVAVLFCDLDGFKSVNDSMGHEAGDELIREFAARLRRTVRRGDITARVGGDEFVVVAPDIEHEWTAREMAENIRAEFETPIEVGAGSALMMPSIGVAVASRSNPARPEEVVAQADQAMYSAKRSHSGVEVFDDDSRREVLDRLEVRRALVPALADGQFQVHYQPIVSESESRVVGLEGLIRWKHPTHGIIGPERFLPVAEEAGLVARLGDVVLREVAAQASVWNHLFGMVGGPSVGVNLAERQLVDPVFPERVAEIIEWAGIPATQLDLELSEELLSARIGHSSKVLERLAELGCRIVIDDFGVSQAGFSRIRDLDLVGVVKIDRTIIAGVEADEVARAVVEATVSMARALQLDVVAEGVETEHQRRLVNDLGVDKMQGFLFMRPSPAEVFDPARSSDVVGDPFA